MCDTGLLLKSLISVFLTGLGDLHIYQIMPQKLKMTEIKFNNSNQTWQDSGVRNTQEGSPEWCPANSDISHASQKYIIEWGMIETLIKKVPKLQV